MPLANQNPGWSNMWAHRGRSKGKPCHFCMQNDDVFVRATHQKDGWMVCDVHFKNKVEN